MEADGFNLHSALMGGLRDMLLRHMPKAGFFPLAGAHMARRDCAGINEHRFDRPVVSLLVQGAKTTCIGAKEYSLEPGELLTVGLDMPSSSIITSASHEMPLMTIYFYIDFKLIGDLMLEMKLNRNTPGHSPGVYVEPAETDFLNGMHRLASLLDRPEQIPVRYPIIMREMHYLLLAGPQRDSILGLYGQGGNGGKIIAAVDYLKQHLDRPVRSQALAKYVHMSESALYRNFKAFTGLSPMQYHKQLRLHEARRLILSGNETASLAAIKTGYESVTQFSREYKNLFGLPPYKSKKGLA